MASMSSTEVSFDIKNELEDFEDKLLNVKDDEYVHTDMNESALLEDGIDMPLGPKEVESSKAKDLKETKSVVLGNNFIKTVESSKRKRPDNPESGEAASEPAKKVLLMGGNTSNTIGTLQENLNLGQSLPKKERKIIKLSLMSLEERLKMRAERFGIPTQNTIEVPKQKPQPLGDTAHTALSRLDNKEICLQKRSSPLEYSSSVPNKKISVKERLGIMTRRPESFTVEVVGNGRLVSSSSGRIGSTPRRPESFIVKIVGNKRLVSSSSDSRLNYNN